MKIEVYFLFCLFAFCFCGCQSQNEKSSTALNTVELKELYEKYQEVSYDRKEASEELFLFEKSVKKLFSEEKLSNIFLDSVIKSNDIFSEKSLDGKLLISSWEVIDFGCDHSYRSLLRYKDDQFFLVEYYAGVENDLFPKEKVRKTYPFKIHMLGKSKYLVENTRLACQSERIIEFDILTVKDGVIEDSNFSENKSELFYSATRSDTIYPEFNKELKELSIPVRVPVFNEGQDTGFTKVTEERQIYKYIDGAFVLQKP